MLNPLLESTFLWKGVINVILTSNLVKKIFTLNLINLVCNVGGICNSTELYDKKVIFISNS